MSRPLKRPTLFYALPIGALGAAGVAFPLLLIFTPGLFSYLALGAGMAAFLLAALVAGALSYLLVGLGGVYMFVCTLLVGLCLFVMLKKKAAYFDTALFSAAIVTMMLYLSMNLYDLLSGNTAFYTMQQIMREFWSMGLYDTGVFAGVLTQAQWEIYVDMGQAYANALPDVLPAAICALGAAFGLTNTILAGRFSGRAGLDVKPMRRFSLWKLPRSFSSGLFIMAVGLIIVNEAGLPAANAVTYAVLAVIMLPLFVQGLSTYWFFTNVRRQKSFVKWGMVVLLVLTFPTCLVIMGIFGLTEQIIKLRERIMRRQDGSE
ncbi:YybS family protein [Christensenellaceae bacterium OttesenSCG-928-M15]|nr:YybS family protein [Christensenellaceae bacterium OttesenSCG-928-M15]